MTNDDGQMTPRDWRGWKKRGWGPPGNWHGDGPSWHRARRFLLIRFLGFMGIILLLVLGGMGGLAFVLSQFFGGGREITMLVWLGGCGLALALPMIAVVIAARTFQRVATPIANVMAAADAVASGDLSIRVPEYGPPGEFRRLASSFNRMTEELERAEQQRRNLTADVAHELRTPLHIIQGNLEGVLDGVYEPDEAHIKATLEETQLLARLVNDLRVLSMAEAGELPLKREIIDVAELLEDVATSFSGQAEATGINFTVSLDSDQPLALNGDIDRLNQVLSNLVMNALRHTPSDGAITLQAKQMNDTIHLRVQDTGEGIAPEHLPFIFDRFWRADRARTHATGSGGGLGLAITKQLVQAHDGTISAESELGVGTIFRVVLPVG